MNEESMKCFRLLFWFLLSSIFIGISMGERRGGNFCIPFFVYVCVRVRAHETNFWLVEFEKLLFDMFRIYCDQLWLSGSVHVKVIKNICILR